MNWLDISFDGCKVGYEEMLSIAKRCSPIVDRLIEARKLGYDSQYAAINLPFDTSLQGQIFELIDKIRIHNPAMLIIIGIGGSNLGTKAVQEALGCTGPSKARMSVYYVDTIDPDMVSQVYESAEKTLQCGRMVLINIVTKSGTTTETIANGAIFIELVKRYYPTRYHDCIVVITDTGSSLYDVAMQESFQVLSVPPMVGGRYSVFSAVGLFSLAVMGVDIQELTDGATSVVKQCMAESVQTNTATQSAAILYALYNRGFVIHNFFAFSVDLYALGLWYRQLMAESLGKEYTVKGERINVGITPMVSIGSTDLHSIVELHLGGPRNTSTTFIDVASTHSQLKVAQYKPFEQLVPHIQGKSLGTIMEAILEGTKYAYAIDNRPFMSVTLKDKSAFTIGQFMQWKMLEIIMLGHLFDIDPFIQPQVELYKKKTRDLLAHE